MAAFAFEDRVVGRRVAGAAPHEINVSVSVFILGHDVALGGVVLATLTSPSTIEEAFGSTKIL